MEQNLFVIVSAFLFVVAGIRLTLLYTYWWQVKEYRFDRMLVLLNSPEGKNIFFPRLFWFKILVLGLSILQKEFFLFVPLIFLAEDSVFLLELVQHKLRRPVFTLRAWELVATGLAAIAAGMGAAFYFQNILFLLLFDILLLLAIPFGILWTLPLVMNAKQSVVTQAREKLARIDPLVVGITGSFGKTSTKEFVAAVISKQLNVAKTDRSENTEFGIAYTIVRNLKPGTRVFVAEMGAYKQGEIEKLCRIVSPTIGVLTGISNQHLALFGSRENIKRAKYELIDSLPDDGIAIFNADNPVCRELALKEVRKTIIYTTDQIFNKDVNENLIIRGTNIVVEKSDVRFTVQIGKQKMGLHVPLLGAHFVQNVLGAIAVAHALGMSNEQIAKGIGNIKPIIRTMEPKKGQNGSLVVDDSYSANFDGFLAALLWLKDVQAKRKIVITPGIIELGEEEKPVHQKLGEALATSADHVFLTTKEPYAMLAKGMGKKSTMLSLVGKKELETLSKELQKDDIVLIEGRIPDYMRKVFLS